MLVRKTGGNPNVYGGLWNHALGKMGCLGCGLGTTSVSDISSYLPWLAVAGAAYWYWKKGRL